MTIERRDLGGLVLHDITRAELASMWQATFAGADSLVTYGYSLTVLPRLRDNPEIAEISNRFDVMISDGRGIFWLANAAGERIREHFSLPDAVELALQMAVRSGQRVYLLGATAEVNAEALRRLELRGVAARGRDGYFELAELDQICVGIRAAEADIVLIGISSPKKEQIAEYLRPRLSGCVIIPCGGMIDVIAGLAKREPKLVQKLGATWLYRWIQEPIRLWRPLVVNGLYAAGWLAPLILVRKRLMRDPGFSLLGYIRRGSRKKK